MKNPDLLFNYTVSRSISMDDVVSGIEEFHKQRAEGPAYIILDKDQRSCLRSDLMRNQVLSHDRSLPLDIKGISLWGCRVVAKEDIIMVDTMDEMIMRPHNENSTD